MSVQKVQTLIRRILPLVAAMLLIAPPMVAAAATAGELLEKAIYAEETAGNLDQAIDLYEQVIAEGKQVSKTAAQAQLRLGLCYEKQGKAEAAATAFQAVIDNYPQESDLIAQARKHLPSALKLLPYPWADGEQLQFNMKLATGLDIGTMIYMVDVVKHDGKDVWQCSTRGLVLNGTNSYSEVLCDKESFAPIQSEWMHSQLGKANAVLLRRERRNYVGREGRAQDVENHVAQRVGQRARGRAVPVAAAQGRLQNRHDRRVVLGLRRS